MAQQMILSAFEILVNLLTYNHIIFMKQQHKKQKIMAKKGIKIEPEIKKESTPHKPKKQNSKSTLDHLPTIQNMLDIPKELRATKVKEYFKKVQPFLASFMVKKQGSRVLQLIYKWGSQDIKASIFETILKNWKQLIKSKYALYTISKVSADYQIPNINNDIFVLQNNSEGAGLIENMIAKNPQSIAAKEIYRKVEGVAAGTEQTGADSLETLHNLAMKSIDKGYFNLRVSKLILRLSLGTLIDAQKTKTIDFLIENSKHLIDEQQGVKLFLELVNICDQKQKRLLIKQFRNNVKNILHQSSVSYIALLKLLTEIDDTVSVGNKLIPELLELLPLIEENKKLYNVLISLMSQRTNNFNCLGKFEPEVFETNCKKDENQRLKQIRAYLYDDLIQFLSSEEVLQETCRNNNLERLTLATLKSLQKDSNIQGLQSLTVKVASYLIKDLKTKAKQNKIAQALISDTCGSKLLKNIIFITSEHEFFDEQCNKLIKVFSTHIKSILGSKATFVMSALIQKNKGDELLKEIKNCKPDYDKILIGKFYKEKVKGQK